MSSRLPETDLANIAFKPIEQKRDFLARFIGPKIIKGTYEPFRFVFGDIFNKELPLMGEQEETPWPIIEREIRRRCRTKPDALKMNLDVGKATHSFIQERGITAIPVDVTSVGFGVGNSYEFGIPVLLRYPDAIAAAFLDMRRTGGLSPMGRQFVHSIMHERFRTAYPDLAQIDLQILRYKNNKKRTIVPLGIKEPVYTMDEMTADVRETYRVYGEVVRGEEDKIRRSSGGRGPLI